MWNYGDFPHFAGYFPGHKYKGWPGILFIMNFFINYKMTSSPTELPDIGILQQDVYAIENIPIISSLLDVICHTTNMGFAAVARVTDKKWVACSIKDTIGVDVQPGGELPLETTICNEIRQSGHAVIIDNVAEDPCFASHHTPALYGFQSYISVPIIKRNGEFFGTLCAIDPKPNKLNTPEITGMFTMFAELIAFHLSSMDDIAGSAIKMIAERELHKKIEHSEAKLNIVIETSELATWEVDLLTKEMTYSDRFLSMMGYSSTETPDWTYLRGRLHSSDLQRREEAYAEAFKTGKLNFVGRMVWEDETIHWVDSRGQVFFDAKGTPVRMIGAVRDITAEKNAAVALEKKVAERTKQLHDKNSELLKMNEELQSFTYISGHDLQEPLRKIQSFVAMIEKEDAVLPEKIQNYFGRMQRAAERMQMLITDLLAYSRAGTGERIYEPVDLNQILQEVKDDMKEELHQKNAVVEAEGLCTLSIIPFQMRQLFQNLLSNAIKFTKPGINPHIKIEGSIAAGKKWQNDQLEAETDYCRIAFSDNGIGFENLYNEKVFEVFQRLHGKTEYKGTGIGLAIVKKITENHEGFIAAEGRLGEGALFTIWLPVKENIAQEVAS